jgi:DNA-binding XRE family transcriptional regulator
MDSRRRRAELVARRELVGYSQEQLAHRLEVAVASLSCWERGKRTPSPRFRQALARELQVSLSELNRLIDPDAAPLELDGHQVPPWMSHYDSLVLAAGGLAEVGKSHIAPLLQTKAYAATIERYGPLALTDDQVIERVDVRLARQAVLYRDPDPLNFTALVTEQVLRDSVGGPEVMVEQLDHMVAMAGRPNIDLRVLPADGRAACALGGFELLTRPGDRRPFIAVTISVGGLDYHETTHDIETFVATFEYLDGVALSQAESSRRIRHIRESCR